MTMLNLAAIDLGAESGRLVLGSLDGERVRTEELHRFDSRPVRLPTGLHTDVAHIWSEIGVGLQAVAATCGGRIDGVGVDTWGVDFSRSRPPNPPARPSLAPCATVQIDYGHITFLFRFGRG